MENVEDVYPLTPVQQGMLFHTLFEPTSGVYVEHLSWIIRGDLDIKAFERAWQEVVNRHPILRSAFFVEGLDEPLQVVRERLDLSLQRYDWRDLPGIEQEERLKSFLEDNRLTGFELSRAPLMHLALIHTADDAHRIVWTHHHMLMDGWSTSLVLKEVFNLYRAFSMGQELSLAGVCPYRDYIAWIQRQDTSNAEAFWREALKGFYSPTPLRADHSREEMFLFDQGPATEEIRVTEAATAALQTLARQNQLTLNTVVQGAWALLLARHSGEQDVVFGSIVSNRPPDLGGVQDMVGLFLNALAVRVQVDPEALLLPWLKQLQARQVEARQYEFTPLVQVQGWSEVPRGQPLFESTLAFENFPVDDILQEQAGGLKVEDLVRYGSRSNYPINVVVEPHHQMLLQISYDTKHFEHASIVRMLEHFKTLLEAMAANPERRLWELPLLTETERRQIVVQWNDTETDYEHSKCIQHLFEEQVERTPEAIALEFEGTRLNYRDLNRRANQMAHHLRSIGVGPEVRVGLCVDRSLEMVVGLIGILKAGGAYLPIDPTYPQERLGFILQDAQVPVLLTQEHLLNELPSYWAQIVCLDSDWDVIAQNDDKNPVGTLTSDNLAYVIYTSGSTGKPKGVLISHRGLCNLAQAQIRAFEVRHDSRVLLFASISFDASVSEIFTTLLTGATLCAATKESLLPGPSLTKLLLDEQVTIATFPPSALAVLPAGESFALQTIVAAGEACPADLVQLWSYGRRFLNAYGPTEATVCATIAECIDAETVPHIGRPIANIQVFLLDSLQQLVPVGVPGEICIGGVGLARGYLNRADLTAEKFIPNPFGNQPGARIYRTGDLARYRPGGEIEFLGRIDNQVKVRGYRIELEEIETKLCEHPAVREAVVLAREDEPGDKRLVAYLVSDREAIPTVNELRSVLQKELPDYMIPSAFVMLAALPLSPNGKIDRRALEAPGTVRPQMDGVYVSPRTPTEEVLAGIWAQVLGVERVGIDDSFFVLGGDSIRSVQILSKAQERGWTFTLPQLFELQTVRALAQELKAEEIFEVTSQVDPFDLILDKERFKFDGGIEDAYPLTKLQQGMIYHAESRPDTAMYQSIMSFHVRTRLDVDAFRKAAQHLVSRHSVLRTSFDRIGFSEPLQLVHRNASVKIDVDDLSGLADDQQQEVVDGFLAAERQRHFDWTCPPLLRFHIHRRGGDTFQLTLTASHAIMDGWSDGLFLTELSKHYFYLMNEQDYTVEPPPALAFRDYVALEQEVTKSKECQQYWTDKLSGSTVMRLPRWSAAHRTGLSKQFGVVEAPIAPELSKELVRLAQTSAVLLKSVLLAAHFKVMSVLSGQSDVVTGLVANARPERIDSDRVIGLFLNTLPLRLRMKGGTWLDLIQRIFEVEMELMPYRHYPLAQIQMDQDAQSLFEVCFNFTHFHNYKNNRVYGELEVLGTSTVTETNLTLMAHFSLDPYSSLLNLSLDYDATKLCEEQVKAIGDYYIRTLEAIAREPFEPFESHSPLSPREAQHLLFEVNSTQTDYPQDRCIHELFEEQAERHPDALALMFENERCTYRGLNDRANQVARRLRNLGVGPELLVAICVEPSIEMIVGLLGILKAGGAYVPLDPSYPRERLAFMLEDAQAPVLLTQAAIAERLPEHGAHVVYLDRDWEGTEPGEEDPLRPATTADNLAYVIYTSGSTGKPKGVQISHRSVINFLNSMRERPGLNSNDVLLAVTSLSFDIAGLEIFLPLTAGAAVAIAGRQVAADAVSLSRKIRQMEATVMQATPATWRMLIEGGWKGEPDMKVLCGGEALKQDLAEELATRCHELWNLYGPTETTIWSSVASIGSNLRTISVGHPIANTQIYLLDAYLQPVPIGVPGDLYIGGSGLARGYHNQPVLTAERFVPNPFEYEAGSRLYRTGDVARYLSDRSIEILGRTDHQVKIRGFRIELGDVELALSEHPEVQQAVVLADEETPGDKRLVAYITLNGKQAPAGSDLRSFLKEKLPDYMMPARFVALDRLPLTLNGKIDRKALLVSGGAQLGLTAEYVAPQTELEWTIAAVWKESLQVERVGTHDNFFDLGGHSLLLTTVHHNLQGLLNADLSIVDMFKYPTVGSLAEYVSRDKVEQPSSSEDEMIESIKRGKSRLNQRRTQSQQATQSGGNSDE